MQRTLIKAKNAGFYIPEIQTYFCKYEDFKVEHIVIYEFH
jgi:hypothetical protein